MADPLVQRLNLRHPIVQAPMSSTGDHSALVAEASAAGAFGFIAGAYSPPEEIAAYAKAVRAATSRPFGVNLFAPMAVPPKPADPAPHIARLAPYFAELGLVPPTDIPASPTANFDAQFAAALDSGAAAFSFTFGLLPDDALRAAKARGMVVMGTATTVAEAVALERSGVDAVVVQGAEAGGHRGTFLTERPALVGTMALVPQVVDAVSVPVVAAGGIADGRGIVAALALGASAAALGTAFLTTEESPIPACWKQAILDASEADTSLTRAFSGRFARGIVNRMLTELEGADLPAFPHQNALTRPLRNEAAAQGRPEFLSLWAGQGLGLARRRTAAQLVETLIADMNLARRRICGT